MSSYAETVKDMTVFSEKADQDQGAWFPYFSSRFDAKEGKNIYDDPEPGAAEFRIRSMIPFFMERRAAQKKQHQVVLNPATRAMERISYYDDLSPEDEKKQAEDAWDYAITGIRGAKWADGREIECTRENKLKLKNDPEFDRYLARCLSLLSGIEIQQAEAAEKN